MKLVQLDVPPAMAAYALANGASRDSLKRWYCYEPVPPALENFVVQPVRQPEYEPSRFCPECGSSMVKRTNKTRGTQFWGCSNYPKCKGTIEIDHVISHAADMAVKGLDRSWNGAPDKKPESQNKTVRKPHPLNDYWVAITKLAAEKCGGEAQAQRWMKTPKLSLKQKRPIDLLGTEEGCAKVAAMLHDL